MKLVKAVALALWELIVNNLNWIIGKLRAICLFLKILGINKLIYGFMVSLFSIFLDLYQGSSWLGKFAIILAPPASFVAIMSILENIRAVRNNSLEKYCDEGYELLGPTYAREKHDIVPNNGAPLMRTRIVPSILIDEGKKKKWEEWAKIIIKKIPSRYKYKFKNPPYRHLWPEENYALEAHISRLKLLEKIIEENNNTLSLGVNINFESNKIN